ncbi:MAG: fumarylacetoacetate hydrolase [Microbacterium sp.]|jgi:acylpyruvate hydrolase|nr:fumarylacetoacetate hydrolase [Microbacterium sp.]
MRLATLRRAGGTVAVRIVGGAAIDIDGARDVGALLDDPAWRERAAAADGRRTSLDGIQDADWAPVIRRPGKIICVGLNYRNHILEMGRPLPEHPTLFAKYPEALIGPYDTLVLPRVAADAVDWEAELAVIVGAPARRVDKREAAEAIAGYSIINDVTMRDFQYRTPEWFQGKTFEATAPFGPVMVTADEFDPAASIDCEVDGETVQAGSVDDLVFSPAAIVSYVSEILTLQPGDVIASGTPEGVGHARKPPRYLRPGSVMTTSIAGIGRLRTPIVAEA